MCAQNLVFRHHPLPSSGLVLSSISIHTVSRSLFTAPYKPLGIKVPNPRSPFFKTLARTAGIGQCQPSLAHVGSYWQESGTDFIITNSEDCQRNFKWPLAPLLCSYFGLRLFILLSCCQCLFLFLSVYLSLSFSPEWRFTLFIPCPESVNLMKRKVKHLASIKKHPSDNEVRVPCARVSTENRFII